MRLRYDPRQTLPIERLTRARCRAVTGRVQLQITRYGPVHELASWCARPVEPGETYCPACAAGLAAPAKARAKAMERTR